MVTTLLLNVCADLLAHASPNLDTLLLTHARQGVLIPMISLIVAAILFGRGMAWTEAVPELNRNDDAMMEASLAGQLQTLLNTYAQNALLFCLAARAVGNQELLLERSLINITSNIQNPEISLYSIFDQENDLKTVQDEFMVAQATSMQTIAEKVPLAEDLVECNQFSGVIGNAVLRARPILAQLEEPTLTYVGRMLE